MADKKEEKKEEKDLATTKVYKFKPIIATAKKLPQIDGQDVLEINVPIEEDSDALIGEATKRAKRDNRNKNRSEGELDMNTDEAAIEALLNKKLMDMDVQKTIKDVGVVSLKILENLTAQEEKLKRHDDMLIAIRKQQGEACTGVNCTKDEIVELRSDISGTNEKLNEKISDVLKKIESIDVRTGKIDNKTEKIHEKPEGALCSGRTGCGHDIEIGSSYCPNCGKEIESWDGMNDWTPYAKRSYKK
jgi:hypothetical protein